MILAEQVNQVDLLDDLLDVLDSITGKAIPSESGLLGTCQVQLADWGLAFQDAMATLPHGNWIHRIQEHIQPVVHSVLGRRVEEIKRIRTPLPIHKLKELDSRCLVRLARQPGRTRREKLASQRKHLGVARKFSNDLLEYRMTKKCLLLLDRLWSVGDEAGKSLEWIKKALQDPILLELDATRPIRPNNRILRDSHFNKIWRAYLLLRQYEQVRDERRSKEVGCVAARIIKLALLASLSPSTYCHRPFTTNVDPRQLDIGIDMSIELNTASKSGPPKAMHLGDITPMKNGVAKFTIEFEKSDATVTWVVQCQGEGNDLAVNVLGEGDDLILETTCQPADIGTWTSQLAKRVLSCIKARPTKDIPPKPAWIQEEQLTSLDLSSGIVRSLDNQGAIVAHVALGASCQVNEHLGGIAAQHACRLDEKGIEWMDHRSLNTQLDNPRLLEQLLSSIAGDRLHDAALIIPDDLDLVGLSQVRRALPHSSTNLQYIPRSVATLASKKLLQGDLELDDKRNACVLSIDKDQVVATWFEPEQRGNHGTWVRHAPVTYALAGSHAHQTRCDNEPHLVRAQAMASQQLDTRKDGWSREGQADWQPVSLDVPGDVDNLATNLADCINEILENPPLLDRSSKPIVVANFVEDQVPRSISRQAQSTCDLVVTNVCILEGSTRLLGRHDSPPYVDLVPKLKLRLGGNEYELFDPSVKTLEPGRLISERSPGLFRLGIGSPGIRLDLFEGNKGSKSWNDIRLEASLKQPTMADVELHIRTEFRYGSDEWKLYLEPGTGHNHAASGFPSRLELVIRRGESAFEERQNTGPRLPDAMEWDEIAIENGIRALESLASCLEDVHASFKDAKKKQARDNTKLVSSLRKTLGEIHNRIERDVIKHARLAWSPNRTTELPIELADALHVHEYSLVEAMLFTGVKPPKRLLKDLGLQQTIEMLRKRFQVARSRIRSIPVSSEKKVIQWIESTLEEKSQEGAKPAAFMLARLMPSSWPERWTDVVVHLLCPLVLNEKSREYSTQALANLVRDEPRINASTDSLLVEAIESVAREMLVQTCKPKELRQFAQLYLGLTALRDETTGHGDLIHYEKTLVLCSPLAQARVDTGWDGSRERVHLQKEIRGEQDALDYLHDVLDGKASYMQLQPIKDEQE